VSAEYQEHFGEHAYDTEGNFIGGESSEAQEAWADYYAENPDATEGDAAGPGAGPAEDTTESALADAPVEDPLAAVPVDDTGEETTEGASTGETAAAKPLPEALPDA